MPKYFDGDDKATSPTCNPAEYASADVNPALVGGLKSNKYFEDMIPFYDEAKVKRGSHTGRFIPKGSGESASGGGGKRGEKAEGRARKQEERSEKRVRAGKERPE